MSMQVVILADKNDRASIAVIRSLRAGEVNFRVALDIKGGALRSFASYLSVAPCRRELLYYDGSNSAAFLHSLSQIRKKIGSYVLFPSGEEVLRWAVANKSDLAGQDIILPTVELDVYQAVSDKLRFVALARKFGLDVPKEYAEVPESFTERFVVKPKTAVWNDMAVLKQPILVESDRSLADLRRRNLDSNAHFIQEYLEGPSFYYCGLYDQGRRQLCFTQQTVVQQPGGMSVVKAVPSNLPEPVTANIDAMMAYLGWHGIMMVEVKQANGKYYAIECNPRLWGPLQLAVDNGVDFPYSLWKLSTAQSISPISVSVRPVGYLWLLGFVHGHLLKWQTNAAFQTYTYPKQGVIFRDVWLRRDSYRYVFVEFFNICKLAARKFLKW